MNHLERSLGKALRAKEVAEYLGMSVKFVREHYEELGGICLGRRYRFFEKEIYYAISKKENPEMGSPSEEDRPQQEKAQKGKSVSDQEGSQGLGSHDEAKACRRVVRDDRHDLLT